MKEISEIKELLSVKFLVQGCNLGECCWFDICRYNNCNDALETVEEFQQMHSCNIRVVREKKIISRTILYTTEGAK